MFQELSKVTKDHLDNEISVAAEVTEAGIKAKAKSRFLSAADRLLGSVLDAGSARIEGNTDKHRARTAAEVKLIQTAGQTLADTVANNQDFAIRAFNNFASKAMRRQKKMDTLVDFTLSELKQNPPSEEENSEGQDELSEEFVNRLENYADNASEEELRKKWAKVFAAEVRKPNTISAKTMRIVDELDVAAANLFESLCKFRLGGRIIKCLNEELSPYKKSQLVTAGLILDDSAFQHAQPFGGPHGTDGENSVGAIFNDLAVVILGEPISISNHSIMTNAPIFYDSTLKKYTIPVYVLTKEGEEIASILQDRQRETLNEYTQALSAYLKNVSIVGCKLGDGDPVRLCHWRNGVRI